MNVLLFSGSLRKESLNKKLIAVAKDLVSAAGSHKATVVDLQKLEIPVYDGDIEERAIPDGVKKLSDLIKSNDAVIISSPEYNGSIAGSLKNAIDWLSRIKPHSLEKKPILLMGATPGALATMRAMTTSRIPLDTLGAYTFPKPFGLPKAGEAFKPDGELSDESTKKKLKEHISEYLNYAQSLVTNSAK